MSRGWHIAAHADVVNRGIFSSHRRDGGGGTCVALVAGMTPSRLFAAGLAAVAFVAVCTATQNAAACSPSPCEPARLIGAGLTIPRNAPALPYVASSGGSTTMRLLDSTNTEVATSLSTDSWWPYGSLLAPTGPLAVGTGHHLAYVETCTMLGASPNGSRSFGVGPATPLPTKLGTLHGANWKVGPLQVATSSGSCFSSIEAVTIDLRLTPSTELAAYAALTGYKLRVDGAPARNAYYGYGTTDAHGIALFRVHAACGQRNGAEDNGVTLGEHDIELSAHVAGATTDPPPVVTRLRFSCTDSNFEVLGDEGDAGTDDVQARDASARPGDREPVQPKGDAGAASANAAEQPDTATAGCACTTAGTSRSSSGPLASLLAITAMMAARARRRLLPLRKQ